MVRYIQNRAYHTFFFFLGGPLLYLNGKPCAKRKHLLYHIVLLRCNMVL